jgi:Holliday junction DNA helicase RuvA
MIGYLRGRIFSRSEEGLTLDVGGVGYELHCSVNTLGDLLDQSDIELHVHTSVREDAITLFGFSTPLERRTFQSLLKVNGIGPKIAMKILSATRLENLAQMIESGDVKSLAGLPKVGKKTAEQLILTLRGKLNLGDDIQTARKVSSKPMSGVPSRFEGPRSDVLSALVNLGFRLPDAEKVVLDLPEDVEFEAGIRQGLQALSGSF